MTAMQMIASALEAKMLDWVIGGGTLIVILLAVIGLCTVVRAVMER